MTQFRTIDLPPSGYSTARAPLRCYAPPADLMSQMLQQRRAEPQSVRVRQTIATDAYAVTAKGAVIRMPAGYRRTVVA